MLFEKMMSDGVLVQTDAQVLAYEYMTPIYTLLTEYECEGITMDEALDFLKRHVALFFRSNKKQ